MTKRIFSSFLIVVLTVLLASFTIILGVLYNHSASLQRSQLLIELDLAASGVTAGGEHYLSTLSPDGYRLTWIAADGTVQFDSSQDADDMENHAKREEIQEAFATGYGESARFSSTLTEQTLYFARKLTDGTVLRISVDRDTALTLLLEMVPSLIVILLGALLLSGMLSYLVSRKIVAPLNAIDLDKPLEGDAYDELAPLLNHIAKQQRKILSQRQELDRQKDEFFTVIANMNEGLVLLSAQMKILSINPAAGTFFSTDPECVGRDFYTIERSRDMDRALQATIDTGSHELHMNRNGREYQLNISRIHADAESGGFVILIFDISDKYYAEQSRREFTANVSHELKTPLQSIMGSAELLENGLVKGEDVPQFVRRIRTEAARLLSLIEDTIHLSQLDEQSELTLEPIELYALVCKETELLASAAQTRNVTLTTSGKPVTITAAEPLLHEIVYNLCDNAIKYNHSDGTVTVTVSETDTHAILTVADTGIGIPQAHQPRVFERFYRVDRSRSKETGGTGLGLSIVKHAVQYLGGTITLESKPDQGTVVTVLLPKQH